MAPLLGKLSVQVVGLDELEGCQALGATAEGSRSRSEVVDLCLQSTRQRRRQPRTDLLIRLPQRIIRQVRIPLRRRDL